ncbi:methylenetetrahydrofolate reductase [NAD(P)H] [Alistipes sp. ZOR0009]|uniref:methylenetetrahydrofolate reductase [NAD(P)H] n=1 Tax=Alistipes sp. ZOR0009 TaxID=1339253 RepID=UPI000648F848|nr:methylenetetrahydrofolate reductase [NAD(P)H] [Alistipes sp. ZOR0009]
MKVIDIINRAQSTLFTFELLPPLKGASFSEIEETIEPLVHYAPSYINVTYHRPEVVLKEQPSGLLERRIIKKRPGTVGVSAGIKYKYGIDVVPHLICGSFTREETEDALIDLNFLGIDNVLALRGDAEKGAKSFQSEPGGNKLAIDLVKQVNGLNHGKYVDPETPHIHQTDFCIGVAGYPEKHSEAPNLETDLLNLKAKVDAGAHYIVTQMFFDNQKFFQFVEQCRAIGINVPIIPGIKPISMKKHLTMLPQIFHIDLPQDLVEAVGRCKNNEEVRQVGVEWGIAQSKELKEAGVPVLHYYTMGKPDNIEKIVKEVF